MDTLLPSTWFTSPTLDRMAEGGYVAVMAFWSALEKNVAWEFGRCLRFSLPWKPHDDTKELGTQAEVNNVIRGKLPRMVGKLVVSLADTIKCTVTVDPSNPKDKLDPYKNHFL